MYDGRRNHKNDDIKISKMKSGNIGELIKATRTNSFRLFFSFCPLMLFPFERESSEVD
jgi:preprotein translocase subunit SecB